MSTAEGDQKDKDPPKKKPYRAVYNAQHTQDETELPGKLIRAEGEPKAKDKAVNEAYENVGKVLEFYNEHFKWKSIDNKNADVISSVHFGVDYENACELLLLFLYLCTLYYKSVELTVGKFGIPPGYKWSSAMGMSS